MSDPEMTLAPARAALLHVAGVTALGRSAVASAAAARASVSRFVRCSNARVAGPHAFTISPASYLPPFPPDTRDGFLSRLAVLASMAAAQLPIDLVVAGKRALPVLVGIPSARPGLPDGAASAIAEALGAALSNKGFTPAVETFPFDHAAGLAALGRALQLIERREADVCLVGGVDSYMSFETLAWLHEREQLKSEYNRWGFVPGEGAGFLLVSSLDFAAALRPASRPAVILSAAQGQEETPPRTSVPQTGKGLTAVLRTVLAALPEGTRVDETVCDLNGERWRGDEAGFSIPRVSNRFVSAGHYAAPAAFFGDVGAASGPLFVALAAHNAARGAARGPSTLVWTSSDAGARAAVLLSIPCLTRE